MKVVPRCSLLLVPRVSLPRLRYRVRRVKAEETAPLDVPPPWTMFFDLRERETIWTDGNQGRLVQLIASDRLGISRDELAVRIQELTILVPDIASRFSRMKPELLSEIISSIDKVAIQLLDLKKIFPNADISLMVSRRPAILIEDISIIAQNAEKTKLLLGVDEIDKLVEAQPLLLDPTVVEEVLLELQRLIKGDAAWHLVKNPSLILSTVRGRKRLGEPAD